MDTAVLDNFERIISDNFRDVLIWDQHSELLNGKYFYAKYEKKEIGVFLGYLTEGDCQIQGCTFFLFLHPLLSMSHEYVTEMEKLFYRLKVRTRIRFKSHPYRILKGGFPALVRNMYFDKDCDISSKIAYAMKFFEESLLILKECEMSYVK